MKTYKRATIQKSTASMFKNKFFSTFNAKDLRTFSTFNIGFSNITTSKNR